MHFVCRTRGHLVHMLVDISHPLTRGGLLHEVLTTQQERSDQHAMQRLIIRSILTTVCMAGGVVGGGHYTGVRETVLYTGVRKATIWASGGHYYGCWGGLYMGCREGHYIGVGKASIGHYVGIGNMGCRKATIQVFGRPLCGYWESHYIGVRKATMWVSGGHYMGVGKATIWVSGRPLYGCRDATIRVSGRLLYGCPEGHYMGVGKASIGHYVGIGKATVGHYMGVVKIQGKPLFGCYGGPNLVLLLVLNT